MSTNSYIAGFLTAIAICVIGGIIIASAQWVFTMAMIQTMYWVGIGITDYGYRSGRLTIRPLRKNKIKELEEQIELLKKDRSYPK